MGIPEGENISAKISQIRLKPTGCNKMEVKSRAGLKSAEINSIWNKLDTNGDGILDSVELKAFKANDKNTEPQSDKTNKKQSDDVKPVKADHAEKPAYNPYAGGEVSEILLNGGYRVDYNEGASRGILRDGEINYEVSLENNLPNNIKIDNAFYPLKINDNGDASVYYDNKFQPVPNVLNAQVTGSTLSDSDERSASVAKSLDKIYGSKFDAEEARKKAEIAREKAEK